MALRFRRTTCLKYLVLANMLMKSGINPFDSQEAKPYKNDPEILAMTNLVRWASRDLKFGLMKHVVTRRTVVESMPCTHCV